MWEVTSRAVLVLLAACSDPAARVSLVPIDYGRGPCGQPDTSKTPVSEIRVTAYGPTGDTRRTDGVIDDFPATTEQLGVEVFGGSVVLATGKTAPLDYNDLANKTTIPIAMAPLDGFCQLRDMTAARVQPLVAHAGSGVLIVGGNVAPLASQIMPSAEYYDPATATFTQIPLPMALAETATSLVGASIAELTDGRVVVWSGAALTVFDPAKMAFTNPVFVEARNEQAMFGIDATHLLVTGGCQFGSTLDCSGDATVRRSTVEYQLDAEGTVVGNGVAKPALPASSVRFGGRLFDIGVTADGMRRLTLAGAVSDPSSADQIPYSEGDDSAAVTVAQHLFSQVTELDGGALLTAFAPDGTAMPSDVASIVPAEGGDGIDVARAPKLTGARLIALEDGTAVAIGGDAGISRYQPTTNTWTTLDPPSDQQWPGAITGASLIRLADGTVLVLGGGTAAAPTASAWLFRPSLVGPRIGTVTAFANATGAVLTPTSPATVTHGPNQFTLTAPDDNLTARALVGGPRLAVGSLDASLANVTGGVALIAQETGPSRALVARLVIGQPARIDRYTGSTLTTLCTGAMVTADDFTALHFAVTADSVSAAAGMVTLVSCDFSKDPIAPEAGSWGVAAVANGSLDVVTIAVSR